MSFFSKALRRAEVFLEQVDESVAQASRRLVVKDATGGVDDSDLSDRSESGAGSSSEARGSKAIPRAKHRVLKRNRQKRAPDLEKGAEASETDGNDEKKTLHEETDVSHGNKTDEAKDLGKRKADLTNENEDGKSRRSAEVDEFEQEDGKVSFDGWDEGLTFDEEEDDSAIQDVTTDERKKGAAKIKERTSDKLEDLSTDMASDEGLQEEEHVLRPQTGSSIRNDDISKSNRAIPPDPVNLEETEREASESNMRREKISEKQGKSLGNKQSLNISVRATDAKKGPMAATTEARQNVDEEEQEIEDTDNDFIEALETENDALRDELEGVESELSNLRAEKAKLIKNLKRMKEVTTDLDESLRLKCNDARKLEGELNSARDALVALSAEKEKLASSNKKKMETLDSKLRGEIEQLTARLGKAEALCESLQAANIDMQEKLTVGRLNEAATADGARKEADSALSAYELEVQEHRMTREAAQAREAELESKAAEAASGLAAAKRLAEESNEVARTAKARLRVLETQIKQEVRAREVAFARIADLEEELKRVGAGREDEMDQDENRVMQLQETIQQLENALEAKNVELARLEGECEVMRKSLKERAISRPSGVERESQQERDPEVEKQLRSMADAALRKQAALELLRGENRALQHQLETERKRTREAQAMAAVAHNLRGEIKGILDTDVERGLREGPISRLHVSRRWPKSVEKVLKLIDFASTRALTVLRKEPWLRLAVLAYIVFMNILIYGLLHWHVGVSAEKSGSAIKGMKKS